MNEHNQEELLKRPSMLTPPSKQRLALPIALLLENCRSSGEADEALLACIGERRFDSIRERTADPGMDFEERALLAEDMKVDWQAVFRDGYEFGFLHMNGLKRLLLFRYRLQAERDYAQEGMALRSVSLETEEATELASMIRSQWLVTQEQPAMAMNDQAAYAITYKGTINKS